MKRKHDRLINEGDEFFKNKLYGSTLDRFNTAIQIIPNSAIAISKKREALIQELISFGNHLIKEDISDAIGCFDMVLAIDPAQPDALLNKKLALIQQGNELTARGQYYDGRQCFNQALQIAPDCELVQIAYLHALATRARRTGDFSTAIAQYNTILKRNPNEINARVA